MDLRVMLRWCMLFVLLANALVFFWYAQQQGERYRLQAVPMVKEAPAGWQSKTS